ncbi:MAG TPA: response regulator [Vicinamibacterales bacterium]|nr:response regulator [Vicinamibacterales bacterium]
MIAFPPAFHDDSEYFGEPARLELLSSAAHILAIDDEPLNVELVKMLLARAGFTNVSGLTDARQVEAFIASTPPDLVLLDVHMPERDGFDVLDALAPLIHADRLPVIVVTGDDSSDVRRQALTRGARDFVTKPFDFTEIAIRVRNQLETRLLFHDLRKQNRSLRDSVRGRTLELESARIEMIERLAMASEYRDDSTNNHNTRVGRIISTLATAMGRSPSDADLLARASALHDVGKIGIPDALLRKPGPLTSLEAQVMQSHTTIGARILGGSDMPLLRLASTIALTHHERWDGSGYPRGLKGHDIPLPGRMVAIADAFDAMTTDRPYRQGRTPEMAIAAIEEERGRQFDGDIVDALMACDRETLSAGPSLPTPLP